MVDQTSQFYAILTSVGTAKQANADALGIGWKITHMAVGDGNPTGLESPPLPMPDATARALLNEWRRAPLNQLKVDDKDNSIIVAEQVIPADVGGRWIRELALFDADGDMVAVANCAPTYKPLLSQGSGRTQVVRMNLIVSSSSNVELKIDPSVVLATREWVTEELAKQDFKHSVLAATTAAITLSGLQTVDGVALPAGARVLVKNQAAAKDNGLYLVVAGGPWKRCTDADTSAKVTPGLLVQVEKGAANADSIWQLVTDAPISLGVSALAFEMVAGRTGVAAGTYRSVTVDVYGRVVAATNPTTVAGYGLTDVYTKTQIDQALALKAPLASPAFTGIPKVPTAAIGTNSEQAASTAFVQIIAASLINSAPGALDTLNELAAAMGNDPNFATTMTNALAGKAAKATTLGGYGITDGVRVGDVGVNARTAPLLGSFRATVPSGFYLGYGATSEAPSNATPGAPPGSGGGILGILAITPRADATYYLVFENGGGQRNIWFGQYNVVNESLHWSKALTNFDYDNLAAAVGTKATKGNSLAAYGILDAFTKNETTTAIQTAVNSLVAAAPGALDTLKELATALGNDPNFATSIANAMAAKAPLDSPVFTGSPPRLPTAPPLDWGSSAANTRWVQDLVHGLVQINIAGAGEFVLTNAQAGVGVIYLVGALTGDRVIILPQGYGRYVIRNATSQRFKLTVRMPSGTGVEVAQGRIAMVFTDASNTLFQQTDYDNLTLTGLPRAPTAEPGLRDEQIVNTYYLYRELALRGIGTDDPPDTVNTDLNTMFTGGLYYIGAGCTNTPPGIPHGYMLVLGNAKNYGQQVFFAGGSLMVRTAIAGEFSNWGMPNRATTLDGYGITTATQLQAEAGADNAVPVTPLRVFQAIAKVVKQATETAFGWAKLATQAQVNAGSDDQTIVTPKKMRLGFSISLGQNGYVVFPSWMMGLIFQWGVVPNIPAANTVPAAVGPTVDVALPMVYPTTALMVSAAMNFSTMASTSAFAPGATIVNNGVIRLQNNYAPSPGSISWWSVGC